MNNQRFRQIRKSPTILKRKPGILVQTKILNPISKRKIVLSGPTHLKLIEKGVLDEQGNDIRVIRVIKPIRRVSPSVDVLGNILRFLPQKEMIKMSRISKPMPKLSLLNYQFDMKDKNTCLAFENEDFNILIKNTNLNRDDLFRCAVERNLVWIVKILLADPKVDPIANYNNAIRLSSGKGYLEVVKELLKWRGPKDERPHKSVDPSTNNNYAIGWAS